MNKYKQLCYYYYIGYKVTKLQLFYSIYFFKINLKNIYFEKKLYSKSGLETFETVTFVTFVTYVIIINLIYYICYPGLSNIT